MANPTQPIPFPNQRARQGRIYHGKAAPPGESEILIREGQSAIVLPPIAALRADWLEAGHATDRIRETPVRETPGVAGAWDGRTNRWEFVHAERQRRRKHRSRQRLATSIPTEWPPSFRLATREAPPRESNHAALVARSVRAVGCSRRRPLGHHIHAQRATWCHGSRGRRR